MLYRNPRHQMNVECVKLNEMPALEECRNVETSANKTKTGPKPGPKVFPGLGELGHESTSHF